jgi:hypothetical protein
MWFKHRAWIPIAWILSLGNLAAVWFAAQPAEPWHASTHALLAVLFGLGAQRLANRRKSAAGADVAGKLRELETRLANPDRSQVTQALDAIAIEVERIGEGQRFLTKLMAERDARTPDAIGSPALPPKDSRSSNPR